MSSLSAEKASATQPTAPAASGWLQRRPKLQRWWRYLASSALAAATSQLTFLLVYGTGMAGAQVSSIVSVLAGVPPKFALSRWWVWGRRGAPRVFGEILPYLAVVAITGLTSAFLTGHAETLIHSRVETHFWRVALVGGAFAAVMVGMFAVRYLLFERLVFADRRPNGERRG